jgi:CMP-N,N'-diacetyllegionaminic acid synthase
MKVLGLIPARAGSKGVPGKNIKLLGNKPLIQYTIEAAQKSALLSKIIVSTDSDLIASTVSPLGVEVPFMRPADLAQDTTPTLPVIQHALKFFETKGFTYDAVCLLQVTSPFRPIGFIDNAIRKFKATDADCLVSVLRVPAEYNPHWVFEPDNDGMLKIATGEKSIIPRRQDLPPAFFRDGSVYITTSSVILHENSLYGTRISFIESDPGFHVNIDTPDDWRKAERILERL